MYVHKIKNVARRSTAFVVATAFLGGVVSSALPGIASADALNPLTERSLMLSSSSPGWANTDGSGNATFAPPGSGANGEKTGETFSFRVSTDTSNVGPETVKAMTFQYCTGAAGTCIAPGNVGHPSDGGLTAPQESVLDVNYTSPVDGTDFDVYVGNDPVPANNVANNGWTMEVYRYVDAAGYNTTGSNFVTLKNASGGLDIAANSKVWVVFRASASNYITNPGWGAFFVKINTYDTDGTGSDDDNTDGILDDLDPTHADSEDHIIDGGVTVANVMNESIHITTKVLETMSFSVGTTQPDTVDLTSPQTHGPCDPITINDTIELGDPTAEFSLSPQTGYGGYSYWRLSTNSSAGATVYYSGETLNNTVGDDINIIGDTPETSSYGQEQFGLAIDPTADDYDSDFDDLVTNQPALYFNPTLSPLSPATGYGNGDGLIDDANPANNDAEFAFVDSSNLDPEPLASDNDDVLVCSTAKMRYVANIAASTPAGIYTTKINYIAAPMY